MQGGSGFIQGFARQLVIVRQPGGHGGVRDAQVPGSWSGAGGVQIAAAHGLPALLRDTVRPAAAALHPGQGHLDAARDRQARPLRPCAAHHLILELRQGRAAQLGGAHQHHRMACEGVHLRLLISAVCHRALHDPGHALIEQIFLESFQVQLPFPRRQAWISACTSFSRKASSAWGMGSTFRGGGSAAGRRGSASRLGVFRRVA